MARHLPDKPTLAGLEEKWSHRWEESGIYTFDRSADRAAVFSIDTPPPTVSGSLHIGHVFSYSQTDVVARFQRMRGRAVFYPIGWDDNGLPTERRVENVYGVRCDPSLPDSPTPPDASPSPAASGPSGRSPRRVSRREFVRLCESLAAEDEQAFATLWRRVGLSVDWSTAYTTIGARAQRASQRAFLRLLERGEAYQAEAPTLWDVDFQTPVAQAELEDREVAGAWHRLGFHGPDGPVVVETTRPELLAACVALVAHPEDERYASLFGRTVRTPLFHVAVPVLPHPAAEPDKGSGIAMVCTFGDTQDVVWWRELGLPLRVVIGRDGRLQPVRFVEEAGDAPTDPGEATGADTASSGSGEPATRAPEQAAGSRTGELATGTVVPSGAPTASQSAYERLVGLRADAARTAIVSLLEEAGELLEPPRAVRHAVKHYEKGSRPLEIVTSRQWFIRLLDHREALLARGAELSWHPGFMGARYQSWVEGLASDWNCSRQRHFGVPFPVWYRVGPNGDVDYGSPLLPEEDQLPVDPAVDVPAGFAAEDRDRPGGFSGDPDVMDTWATSSLSPQIVGGWEDDPDLFARVFPFDLRPQAHDIIRTWLFYSVVRSELEHHCLPWANTAISGFIVDPDRKKMSKSKGNVVLPTDVLDEFGSDAVRYWAAAGKLGQDTVADRNQMRDGRRLAIKLLNASRFVLGTAGEDTALPETAALAPLDRALLHRLRTVVREATAALEAYDATRALERVEGFFWAFCDDYVELVKGRAYAGDRSAQATLQLALSTLQRLLAPFLPFATEEAWSWWREGSVHRAPWPAPEDLPGTSSGATAMDDPERVPASAPAGGVEGGPVGAPAGGVEGGPVGALAERAEATDVLAAASGLLVEIRRAKSEARRSMRAPVARVSVTAPAAHVGALELARGDLVDAGNIAALHLEAATDAELRVEVQLEPDEAEAPLAPPRVTG